MCVLTLQWRAANPPAAAAPLAWACDYSVLALAATYVYAAWGLGSSTSDVVPAALQPTLAAMRAPEKACWHQAMALLLLCLALRLVICTRR